jgi:uncharacterized protein
VVHHIEGVRSARNFWLRAVGLIGQRRPDRLRLHIPDCRSIHTFGVFAAIDVLFVSADNSILEIHENLKPMRVCVGPKAASGVVELPAGLVREMSIRLGDTVSF